MPNVPTIQGGQFLNPAQLPAAARNRLAQGQGIAKNLTEGVSAPIDILSIEGKIFCERVNGERIETPRPVYEYDVVILDGTPGLAKTYYINPYVRGSMTPPDCWSLNGIKPDPQAPHIQSPTCRGCRWNVFGSKIMTDRPGQQSKAKACSDSRRLAVLPAYKLAPTDGSDPNPMLLRIPATSLAPLKMFASELERMGIPANAVVTRLGFDHTVTHPQLTFAVVGMLNEMQFSHVEYLLRVKQDNPIGGFEDERVRRILEAPPVGEEMDASELAGQQITNRYEAPAHPQTTWTPGAATQSPAQPAAPVQQAQPQDVIIDLPDGRKFNQTKGVFVEPEPEPAAGPPADAITLPDGRIFVPSLNAYWEPQVAPKATEPEPKPEPAKPISQRAKAPPPASAPAGQAGAPQTGWKPGNGAGGPQAPGPGWRPPQGGQADEQNGDDDIPEFLKTGKGPVIDGTATEVQTEAQPAAQPKKRKPAPPAADAQPGAQEAPASLDALLTGLDLEKK